MMLRRILLGVVLSVLLPTFLVAQEQWLRGKVVTISEHGEELPGVNVTMTIEEIGNSGNTTSQGIFRISLPQTFKHGEKVTLAVDKPKWRVHYPWGGEAHVPADLQKELVRVRLAPLGSPVFLCPPCLEKFLRDMMEQSKQPVTPQGKIEELDVGRYIKEWATKYGFSPQQVKEEVDKWIAEVEKNWDDLYKLGLAAFAKKEFNKASKLFLESAEHKAKKLEEIRQKERDLIEEVVRDFRLAGDSHIRNNMPADALQSYRLALQFASKEDMPQLWAATWRDIGNANNDLSLRVKGAALQKYLDEAVQACRRAMEVYTRQDLPREWAKTQLLLALVLVSLGNNRGGEESAQLWTEAQRTLTQALEIVTREELPPLWALAQHLQGALLLVQASRIGGQERAALLGEAEGALQRASEVFTRAEFPKSWALTQFLLGFALRWQLSTTSAEEHQHLLSRTVAAYQHALEVLTPENDLVMRGAAQSGLGSALKDLGHRETGGESAHLLEAASAAYRQALEAYTRDDWPQLWASIEMSHLRKK